MTSYLSPTTLSRDSIFHSTPNYGSQFSVLHMELLHHYSTSTCYTLSQNPAIQTIWQVTILRLPSPSTCNSIFCSAAYGLHQAS